MECLFPLAGCREALLASCRRPPRRLGPSRGRRGKKTSALPVAFILLVRTAPCDATPCVASRGGDDAVVVSRRRQPPLLSCLRRRPQLVGRRCSPARSLRSRRHSRGRRPAPLALHKLSQSFTSRRSSLPRSTLPLPVVSHSNSWMRLADPTPRLRLSSRLISTSSSSAAGRRSGPAGALSFPTFDPASPERSPECHRWSPLGGRRRRPPPLSTPVARGGRHDALAVTSTGWSPSAARGRRRRHCWLCEEDATAPSSRPPLLKEKAASAAAAPRRKDATPSPTPPSDPLPNPRRSFVPAGSPEPPPSDHPLIPTVRPLLALSTPRRPGPVRMQIFAHGTSI